MTIWVVRHGLAGRKRDWPGDDDLRPLDALGHRQAETVADVLAGRHPTRLASSPTRRCVDTLVPLAARLDRDVLRCDALRANAYPGGLLLLLENEAMPGDVVCTHGELMRPALAELHRRGAVPDVYADDDLLAKGAVWEMDAATMTLVRLLPEPGTLTGRSPES